MFNWLLSKQNKNKIDSKNDDICESNSDSECDNNSDAEQFYTNFELLMKPNGQILHDLPTRKICLVEPSNLVNFVKPFSYNRNIDENHKKKLYNVLCDQKNKNLPIELYGLFEGFMTKSNTIYLANGHHRFFAYKDFLTDHANCTNLKNIKIELFVFDDLDDIQIEEDERIIDLFKAVNTSKEFQFDDLPVSIIYECFKMLNEKYNNCIKQGSYIRKPFINKTKFYEYLKSNNIHLKYKTSKKLCAKLIKINESIETKDINYFFDKLNPTRINQFEKAKKIGFYIGLMNEEDLTEELLH